MCHNSNGQYLSGVSQVPPNLLKVEFSHKCVNDDQSYQACDSYLMSLFSKTFKPSKNAICGVRISGRKAEWVEQEEAPLESNETVVLPSGRTTYREYLCNDKCDTLECEDEAYCNGLMYGRYCHEQDTKEITWVPPEDYCTDDHLKICCRQIYVEMKQNHAIYKYDKR